MPRSARPVIVALARVAILIVVACVGPTRHARAEDRADADRLGIRVNAETHMRLFQRAPLPGAGGAVVTNSVAAPLYHYASLGVTDIDTPWLGDSLDVELSAWGSAELGQERGPSRLDGDIQVASVRHRFGPAYAKLGRQFYAGGAARFSHFDGLTLGLGLPNGLGADAYGGLVVLPRWSERPGYHTLGSAADTLLRTPEVAEDPTRADHWLVGGRVHYAYEDLGEVGASFHEQHETGGLGRRNLGLDLKVTPHEVVAASAQAIVDGDAWGLTEARTLVDVFPLTAVTVTAEFRHTTPALFLSRQSVLSVFSTDPFDEFGGVVGWKALEGLWLGGGGYADLFGDGSVGGRWQADIRVTPPGLERLVLRMGYRRVVEPLNGYHAPRLAAGYRIIEPLQVTTDWYTYLYDEPIRNIATAWMGGGNVEWSFHEGWALLLGGSVSRSPYALLDAQALARLRFDQEWRLW